MTSHSRSCLLALIALTLGIQRVEAQANPAPVQPVVAPLTIQGQDFVDPAGQTVRFWGVNLVGLYPDHNVADAMAADLAARQINLVRPHHNLRPSGDWNPKMISGSLLTYKDTSREFDKDALDRFDYLNAALRKNGIYLAFSAHWTRKYLPGDASILATDSADRDQWMAAMKELNSWPWQKGFDVIKMLPVVDERAARLNEEFTRKLLTHVNPYTGKPYAGDPQILTYEVTNESSTEYAILCGNKFPEYFQKQLIAKWETFAGKAGVIPGDLYKPADAKVTAVRAQFLRSLDQAYFDRIKAVIRGAGCNAAMTFSNLWRGENALQMHSQSADEIENHAYANPLVVQSADDLIIGLSHSALVGKPFFVGELNQSESSKAQLRESPVRSMLPLAVAAYGSLQDWSGVTWFAWTHGDLPVGADGWAKSEGRVTDLGRMINDGMMIDHLRTTGLLFKRGLVATSTSPITLTIDEPLTAGNYNDLMRGKYNIKLGWQDVHEVRKAFGSVPAGQPAAAWMTQDPPSPITSDTGQIVKDIKRQQFTVAAPMVEAFSGTLDDAAPAGLKHLRIDGKGFATVIAVADDSKEWPASEHWIVSRTALDAGQVETGDTKVSFTGLKPAAGGSGWFIKLTRPREASALIQAFEGSEFHSLTVDANGAIALPAGDWHECELVYRQ